MNNGNLFIRSKDNVIISDLLFSIYNGFLSQAKNIVIETNAKFYTVTEIWNEKTRFFEAVGKTAKSRRQTEKSDSKLQHNDC